MYGNSSTAAYPHVFIIAQNTGNHAVESKQYTGSCMHNTLKLSDNFLTQICRLTAGFDEVLGIFRKNTFQKHAKIIMQITGGNIVRLPCERQQTIAVTSFTKYIVRGIKNSDFENLLVLFICYLLYTKNVKIIPTSPWLSFFQFNTISSPIT